ncbi:T-cell activation Rho GTPase-activating protein [Merluccius polli]|uniref:T-cell activation Rho GTPase-activating protein n=1 Tax=Merluccius polli TaxID=89951 RepID=A0AA47MA34_MERPO|nr:T-cell activation Rho GTPase-activating protein [Merluccius polli]
MFIFTIFTADIRPTLEYPAPVQHPGLLGAQSKAIERSKEEWYEVTRRAVQRPFEGQSVPSQTTAHPVGGSGQSDKQLQRRDKGVWGLRWWAFSDQQISPVVPGNAASTDMSCGDGARRHGVAAAAVMRRGSYDDSAVSLRPHLRSLAHRRRSAPSLAFGKSLPWSPIRSVLLYFHYFVCFLSVKPSFLFVDLCTKQEAWPSVDQCPFVLGLSSENGELLLDQRVRVTEGNKTKDRHLFLFSDVLVFAKLKSSASYRLKHRVNLGDIWVYSFDDDDDDDDDVEDEAAGGDADLRVTLVLAWGPTFCMVSFCSPGVKERWLDTLHREIIEARATSDVTTPTPHALMKVLSGNIMTKTLTGVGMEPFIEFQSEDNIKLSGPCKPVSNQEDRLTQPIENSDGWNIIRRLRRSLTRPELDSGAQLFGQPLLKICPDTCSLPKPVTDMLVLLWKKGPAMEGVFRKPGNSRSMREIREQLNAGLSVNMEELPVVLLVALLKCFLKELPGSLLVSELYDSWVKALDADEGQQRSSQIMSVLGKLPMHNQLLLQQLLCVLHHILERSNTNKMDARNLAVCIAPTLLQLNTTPLEEQKGKLEKVTELTQYLIEHCCELLGENIVHLLGDTDEDSDSLSAQLHDSAYDSTDPDAEGEPAECAGSVAGLSRSLPCSTTASTTTVPSCASGAFTKLTFNRRCSEPTLKTLFPPVEATSRASLSCLARSHDDCSLARREGYDQQPLKKQISDDSILLRKLADPAAYALLEGVAPSWNASRSSNCSLESAASNQSEGSVFNSSPQASPTCPRKWTAIRQPRWGATPRTDGGPVPDSEGKRRSQSMRLDGKVSVKMLKKTSGFSFRQSSLKTPQGPEGDAPPEDSQSQPLRQPRPQSAIEAFQLPRRPPSYEQAVQSAGMPAPPLYRPLTVQDAQREQGQRSSVSEDFLSSCSDCFSSAPTPAVEEDQVGLEKRPFRQRAMSESVSRARLEAASRRCSQPVFEEYPYAKESYV